MGGWTGGVREIPLIEPPPRPVPAPPRSQDEWICRVIERELGMPAGSLELREPIVAPGDPKLSALPTATALTTAKHR
jgi:hypothetical protein